MTHFFTHHGLPVLFVVVMLESFGFRSQADRADVFGVLASKGDYGITSVIVFATFAAITATTRLLAHRPPRRPSSSNARGG